MKIEKDVDFDWLGEISFGLTITEFDNISGRRGHVLVPICWRNSRRISCLGGG